jgi:putative lipoic acid-binding regulatory protein
VSPVDAGTTTITVRDSSGGYSTVSVTVSITGVGLSSSRRL